ncbi:helix-turn-helix domain-containing protein [Wenxinia saemankumensis]|uniref:Transcriptional regulator, AraC family n=1 Tax=Wenxinia saemankumensis TaxID=1447782 RepID=A0A1M6B4Y6_9RHOB|nr:AraC family transcriptional regulator [Wenxinia saemankumensis]SHI43791.1 transcriptional regulator, AraC family [Wenxinia saemankumensis]
MPDLRDYFVYLPRTPLCEALGCTALSTGHTRIAPGSPYPPARHPDDHHFVWEKGRTLQAYQFALISEGTGQLSAAPDPARVHPIGPGDVILLYPGIWHRFAPNPATGWVEHWMEVTGPAFDAIMARGLLPVDRPVWSGGAPAEAIFRQIHALALDDSYANQLRLSTLGLQLLALLLQDLKRPTLGEERLVERARRLLGEHSQRLSSLEELSEGLGVSYPTLRRLFLRQTGMSMKQYQTEVRIRRACELLRSSDRSIKEIAGHLGYNSAYHFSARFRHATGLPPTDWRTRNRAQSNNGI